ncbi:hypothetical protein EV359DRAFT_65580 [Lentinula novae-zelandiae]|nr:hypothetical protein EV359DRAFT_65580 [Lentinula novae-zelandiae]
MAGVYLGLEIGDGVRPGSELVLGVLGASWSLKGATGTATEDRNDLQIVAELPMECKPGREVPGSGGRGGRPRALEVVTEKRYIKVPELVEQLGSLRRFGGGWLTKTIDIGEL